MATDARGHTVPTGRDFAARKSLTDLSLSIPSMRSCTSQSAVDLYLSALADAGITPSVDHPVYVYRSDLQDSFVYSGGAPVRMGGLDVDWTGAVGLGGWGGNPQFCVRKGVVYARGVWTKVGGATSIEFNSPQLGSLPSTIPPPTQDVSVSATNGVSWAIGLRVTTSGLIYARCHSGTATFPDGQYINQDGLRWPVS